MSSNVDVEPLVIYTACSAFGPEKISTSQLYKGGCPIDRDAKAVDEVGNGEGVSPFPAD